MLHMLLLTADSIIQTVVVSAREDVHCNIVTINIWSNCNERHLCSLIKASSIGKQTHYLFSRSFHWLFIVLTHAELRYLEILLRIGHLMQ